MSEFKVAQETRDMVASPAPSTRIQATWRNENGIFRAYGTSAVSVLNAQTAGIYAPGCEYTLVSGATSKLYINRAVNGAVSAFVELMGGAQAAAPTAALTDMTQAGSYTPDFAIQAITNTTPFGFVNAAEGETVVEVVQANKVNIAEIIAALQAVGIMAS